MSFTVLLRGSSVSEVNFCEKPLLPIRIPLFWGGAGGTF